MFNHTLELKNLLLFPQQFLIFNMTFLEHMQMELSEHRFNNIHTQIVLDGYIYIYMKLLKQAINYRSIGYKWLQLKILQNIYEFKSMNRKV